MKNLNLQQLAGIIDDEDLFVTEVINHELYKRVEFVDILGVSLKLLNEPIVQKFYIDEVLDYWPNGELPDNFNISEDINPLEAVPGGWKWNESLAVDDLNWNTVAFEGKPVIEVSGDFNCSRSDLTTLVGAPRIIGKSFYCGVNNLVSLNGGPILVGGDYVCGRNKLIDLNGAPENIPRNFDVTHNKLKSFEGSPKSVGGDFYCGGNPKVGNKRPDTQIGGDFYNV